MYQYGSSRTDAVHRQRRSVYPGTCCVPDRIFAYPARTLRVPGAYLDGSDCTWTVLAGVPTGAGRDSGPLAYGLCMDNSVLLGWLISLLPEDIQARIWKVYFDTVVIAQLRCDTYLYENGAFAPIGSDYDSDDPI